MDRLQSELPNSVQGACCRGIRHVQVTDEGVENEEYARFLPLPDGLLPLGALVFAGAQRCIVARHLLLRWPSPQHRQHNHDADYPERELGCRGRGRLELRRPSAGFRRRRNRARCKNRYVSGVRRQIHLLRRWAAEARLQLDRERQLRQQRRHGLRVSGLAPFGALHQMPGFEVPATLLRKALQGVGDRNSWESPVNPATVRCGDAPPLECSLRSPAGAQACRRSACSFDSGPAMLTLGPRDA
mmetsp:Transcript_120253/g.345692  ORF Transcript_120253/g.345692 Transcript_120253/m.345692 type:complete len:243 (-) Transcript_120253:1-729(-)